MSVKLMPEPAMNKTLFLSTICLGFLLSSCSSPSARESRLDVRPGVDGIHKVVIISKNQVEGSREALNQADQYCKEIKKSAYFFNSQPVTENSSKPKTTSSQAPTKKPAADESETDKVLTVEMLFKCL
jgi:hypothetical protein